MFNVDALPNLPDDHVFRAVSGMGRAAGGVLRRIIAGKRQPMPIDREVQIAFVGKHAGAVERHARHGDRADIGAGGSEFVQIGIDCPIGAGHRGM